MNKKSVTRFESSLVLALALVSNLAFALPDRPEVDQIRSAIREKGANWRSADTWVSRLNSDELAKMMGSQEAPTTDVDFTVLPGQRSTRAPAPASLDWRKHQGVNWDTPMLNQGACGSCVAFAGVATLETQYNITAGVPGLNPRFSTQALFACGGGSCDYGWFPALAVSTLKSKGTVDEACAPYTMGATGVTSACSLCSDSAARTTKIIGSYTASSNAQDVEAVKQALQKGPMITTMTVYPDFLTYTGGIYKHVSGNSLGGHAISLVGYDTPSRTWIIRNSWGTEWGEGGYGRISWDDVSGVGKQTWGMQLSPINGYVKVTVPAAKAYVSGLMNLSAETTVAGASAIDLKIVNSQGGQAFATTVTGVNAQTSFDTSSLPDGRYEAKASTRTSNGVTNSQNEEFYVLNRAPAMTLSFAGKSPTDLNRPLKDRIELSVSADSGTVPLSDLTFHVYQNGQEVLKRSTQSVLPRMILGWRTPTVANGTYEIYLTGKIQVGSAEYKVESARKTVTVSN